MSDTINVIMDNNKTYKQYFKPKGESTMAKMKYWDQGNSQWVALDQKNSDKLGGVDAADYQLKTEVQQVDNKIGDLSTLETTIKTDIVNALNEVQTEVNNIDLTSLIDDSAGVGVTDKAWSADKIFTEFKTKVTDQLGAADGIATLDSAGLVPAAQIPKEYKETKVVADIQARDALDPATLYESLFIYVLDASADTDVTSGAALYIYAEDTASPGTYKWYKVAETESLDVQLQWSDILGKPTSSVADIDDAVTKRHTHSNKTQLDLISENGTSGNLEYDGQEYTPLSTHTTDITGVQGRLDILEGDATTEGSVAKAEQDAKDYADTVTQPKADKVGSATLDNLASLTADGNLADSGLAKNDVMMVHVGTSAPADTSYFWVDTTV